MATTPKFLKSLYWRISATFLLILLLLAAVYLYISVTSAKSYYQEVSQRLNAAVAEHTVNEVSPFIDGEVNEQALHDIMHSMMVINPSVEVYLLDTDGNILSYVAPYKKVKLESVSLKPVNEFIDSKGEAFVQGDDPRNPGVTKVFSAAPVYENEQLAGYIYVILASEEYESVTQTLLGSYILKLGTTAMIITLVATLIIGLLAIWFLTKNLRKIIQTVKRFQKGDTEARVNLKSQGEITGLADSFNAMADTIVKNIEELKLTEELRRELVANISHDLRTPISSIHGYVETIIMKDDLSAEEKERYMNIVLENTQKLKKMVDELFELSKLEAKETKAKPEPLSLGELVHDVSNKYRLISQEKGISINTLMAKNLPLVHADIALIDRALQNIIDNALKFCRKGDFINIELNQVEQSVEVKIIDSGPGIPKEDLPHIFSRYHKGNGNTVKSGTGLGLAIVKKILELHESEVLVSSEVNKGTVFSFALPVHSVAA